jgi:hypothetical protein
MAVRADGMHGNARYVNPRLRPTCDGHLSPQMTLRDEAGYLSRPLGSRPYEHANTN